jgi:hypothetical protein
MRETKESIEPAERNGNLGHRRYRPATNMTWSMTATATPHRVSDFESVLLAIAGTTHACRPFSPAEPSAAKRSFPGGIKPNPPA